MEIPLEMSVYNRAEELVYCSKVWTRISGLGACPGILIKLEKLTSVLDKYPAGYRISGLRYLVGRSLNLISGLRYSVGRTLDLISGQIRIFSGQKVTGSEVSVLAYRDNWRLSGKKRTREAFTQRRWHKNLFRIQKNNSLFNSEHFFCHLTLLLVGCFLPLSLFFFGGGVKCASPLFMF